MANSSTRRVVARPGVNTEGKTGFVSPFQPPPAMLDFEGDLLSLDSDAYTIVHVANYFWRVKTPGPDMLQVLAALPDAKGGEQIHLINRLMKMALHPEDFRRATRLLLTPGQTDFTVTDYMELYRRAATVGTARPFQPSSGSRAQRRSRGERSGRSSSSRATRRR